MKGAFCFRIFAVILAGIIICCSGQKGRTILVNDQRSDYVIVVSKKADELTKKAAQEIQDYIFKVTDFKMRITNIVSGNSKSIVVGKKLIKDLSTTKKLSELAEDGYIIKITGNNVYICGNDGKTDLYAAYTFIEEFLGCMLLAPGEEFIPKKPTIEFLKIDKTYQPAFSFRRVLLPGLHDEQYRYWHKIEQLDQWGMFVHTFNKLIPPEQYFEKHPQYFSLVGGRRLEDAQLCLSNPEVISLLKKNLRREMDKKPGKKYWSVSQNDCINYCECDQCKALYKKYGEISGVYIHMANQIAQEFADKQISTLAYQFTRSAPKNITPLKNVNIMFCSIECNRSMPLEEDKRSKSFVKDMKDWGNLTPNIFVWDYVVQFKNYLTPFPNFKVLQPNIRFFKKNRVNMMFQQGSNSSWSDLAELKQYLIAKLLWNPEADAESIINGFIDRYYGPAGPYIKAYFDLTHQALEENREIQFLNIYGFPVDYSESYLTPPLLKQYRELMDLGEESVKHHPEFLSRVLRTRLAVDFAYLDIALNKNHPEISFIQKKGSKISIRPDMIKYLDRFVKLSEETGITRINERNFLTQDYQKYVFQKLKMMTKTNLARGKTIQSLTKHSEVYPVGGKKALTDGLFGDLDFHNNWLGFQGNDMVVKIDLLKPETVEQISMNFLKAVNSWVFLPLEVLIEVSEDGKEYTRAGSIMGDILDKNYLVKSVPYLFKLKGVKVQYLRITATSLKKCPKWHRGFGNPSWIFIDELIVE